MIVTLHTQGLKTLAQVRAFVSGNEPISFTLTDRLAAYGWMADTLGQFAYPRCKRADKGVLRKYLCKVTGFSRAQVVRCIMQFTGGGRIMDRRRAPAVPFVRRYTVESSRGISPCVPVRTIGLVSSERADDHLGRFRRIS